MIFLYNTVNITAYSKSQKLVNCSISYKEFNWKKYDDKIEDLFQKNKANINHNINYHFYELNNKLNL